MDWQTIAGLIARHIMTSLAGALVTLGLLQASDQNNFISIGSGIMVGVLGLAWSWWQKAGYAKLKVDLANLARNYSALKQSQTKAVVTFLALALGVLLLGGQAMAQSKKAMPEPPAAAAPVQLPILFPQNKPGQPQQNPLAELAAKIRALSLADFKYASALAHATGNTVSASCWDEWVKLLTAQQQPLKDADGNALTEPDPHLVTDIERLSEMIAQLQPRSELSVACAPLASTTQKDAATLIGAVLSGGAMGLFKLPFAIP